MLTISEIAVTLLSWGLLAVGLGFALRARRRRKRASRKPDSGVGPTASPPPENTD